MKFNSTFSVLALTALLSISSSCAQPKQASAGAGNSYMELLEASVQRTLPGIKDAEIETTTRFVVIWKSNEQPLDFFWKAPDVWQNCMVSRASRAAGKTADNGDWYTATEIDRNAIKKGDTLELTPLRGGKYAVPPGFDDKNNVILFKTNKTDWLYLPVKNLTKRPDIIMQ